jgi:hypothetical protein
MRPILILILAFCSLLAVGQTPSHHEINSIANSWLLKKNSYNTVKFKNTAKYQVRSIKQCEVNSSLFFHVVELNPKGFIVISNNKSIDPILAYSFASDFPNAKDSTNVFFQMLSTDLLAREETTISQIDKWGDQSNQLLTSTSESFQQWPAEGSTSTGGWIEAAWIQSEPYNNYCPLDLSQPGNPRSYVGCVATAWAQIINYHKPTKIIELNEQDRYKSVTLGINLDADSTKNDFPSFSRLNQYMKALKQKYQNSQPITDQDIATLNLFAGIESKMDYTAFGSGASIFELPYKLKSGFNSFKAFLGFGASDWTDFYPILKSDMMNGLPAIFTIMSSTVCTSGHAIVSDGYNTDGFYHLNFGWGSDSPDNIMEAWYNLPSEMPMYYNLISEAVVELTSDRKPTCPIKFSRSNIQFGGVKVNTYSNSIHFSLSNPTSRTVSITPGTVQGPFEISLNNIDFTKSIGTFSLAPNEQKMFYVRGNPVTMSNSTGSWFMEIQDDKKFYYMMDFGMTGIDEIGSIVLPGEISGTWTKENSPYLITGDVYVKHSETLKINPGVKIIMKGSYKFGIPNDSRIVAIGTRSDSIKFYAEDPVTGWLGIDFMRATDFENAPAQPYTPEINNTFAYCIIRDGIASESYPQWCGGAIFIHSFDNNHLVIKDCKITNNKALSGGAITIQGMWNSKIQVMNTLITSNIANQLGIIDISGTNNGKVEFNNVTITENDIEKWGTINLNIASSATFINCIIWNNDASNSSIFSLGYDNHGFTEPDTIKLDYCNIDTTHADWLIHGDLRGIVRWGEGNIVEDPGFELSDGNNYYLSAGSPCIDAGNPDPAFYDQEDPVLEGQALYPAMGSLRNDMGCYGGGMYYDLRAPELIAPPDDSEFNPGNDNNFITFIWQNHAIFSEYDFQISTSQQFDKIFFEDSLLTTNTIIVNRIGQNNEYFWRVRGRTNINTTSTWSEARRLLINGGTSGIESVTGIKTVSVYPNPTSNDLYIEIEGSADRTSFMILNSVGQIVAEGSLFRKTFVNTSDYPSGVYYIKFENGDFRKIVKYTF